MYILKQRSGWCVYSDGTASENPSNLIIINPCCPEEPINFEKLTGWKSFCDIDLYALTPKPGLLGCSDLLLADWNNGITHLWIVGCRDSKLKYQVELDTGYETREGSYYVDRVTAGIHEVWGLMVNDKLVWPDVKK